MTAMIGPGKNELLLRRMFPKHIAVQEAAYERHIQILRATRAGVSQAVTRERSS